MSKLMGVRELKKRLRRIVNERGHEYTYIHPTYENEYGEEVEAAECYYTDQEGNPSCIVGALLSEVAPGRLKTLHHHEWVAPDVGYSVPNCFAVYELERGYHGHGGHPIVDLGEVFTDEARRALATVQREQDQGKSWGDAVDEVYKRH